MTAQKSLILLAAALLLLSSCGDEDHHHDDHHHESGGDTDEIALKACEMADESGEALTAGDSIDKAGDAVVHIGNVYSITLPDSGVGYITYHCTVEHTDHITFTRKASVIKGIYDAGELVATPIEGGNETCGESLAGQYTIHLDNSQPYIFEIQGEPGETVWFLGLIGSGGHQEAGDDDHSGHGG